MPDPVVEDTLDPVAVAVAVKDILEQGAGILDPVVVEGILDPVVEGDIPELVVDIQGEVQTAYRTARGRHLVAR